MNIANSWKRLAPKPRPLTAAEEWNVFLSYRSVNRAWVLNLYDVLRDQGHKVFLDQCVLRAGDQLIRKIEDGLSKSQAGVLVWSNASRESEWVRREYETMERKAGAKPGFQFVPVRLDQMELPDFAANRIFLDFSAYPDGPNGGELLRLLHAVVGQPLTPEAARFANEQDEAAQRATAAIQAAIKIGLPQRLIQRFTEGGLPWEASAALGCKAAEGLTKLAHYDEAIQMLTNLEPRFPRAIRPKQLRALALARRGRQNDLETAQTILAELYELGHRDPETVGIYARTWMDRYNQSGDSAHLKQSRDLYAEAFEAAQDDYYTGINAAAKSVFLGTEEDLAKAAEYARRVQGIVGTSPRPGDYWLTATIAEVLLIQRQYRQAGQLYEAAVSMARSEIGSHKTTWKQARRLLESLRPDPAERALIRRPFEHLPDSLDA